MTRRRRRSRLFPSSKIISLQPRRLKVLGTGWSAGAGSFISRIEPCCCVHPYSAYPHQKLKNPSNRRKFIENHEIPPLNAYCLLFPSICCTMSVMAVSFFVFRPSARSKSVYSISFVFSFFSTSPMTLILLCPASIFLATSSVSLDFSLLATLAAMTRPPVVLSNESIHLYLSKTSPAHHGVYCLPLYLCHEFHPRHVISCKSISFHALNGIECLLSQGYLYGKHTMHTSLLGYHRWEHVNWK